MNHIDGDGSELSAPLPEHVALPAVAHAVPVSETNPVSDANRRVEVSMIDSWLGRPGILVSLFWTFLLLIQQVVMGIGIAILIIGVAAIRQKPLAEQMQYAMEVWMIPVASFLTMTYSFGVVLLIFQKQAPRFMGLRGCSPTQTGLVLLLTLPAAAVTSEFTNYMAHVLPNIPLDIFDGLAKQSWWLVILGGCLFPALGEEVYFRGFLGRGLVSRYGVIWGTIGAAFLFGLVHLHPVQASGAFLIGLALQIVFLKTQSLWAGVLMHAANNSLAFATKTYGEHLPIDGFTYVAKDEILHSPPFFVGMSILTTISLLWGLHQARTEWRNPDGTLWSPGYPGAEGPAPDSGIQATSRFLSLPAAMGIGLVYAVFLFSVFQSVRPVS